MYKKAQAAMEFLMTYGWAILVVLVAIGALAYFGVLSPDRFLPEKCVISTGSGLFCDDFAVDATADTITLRVHNILTDQVTITGASSSITWANGGSTCNAADLTLAGDATDNLVFSCTLASGEKIKGDIVIAYQKAGGLSKSTTGTLISRVS